VQLQVHSGIFRKHQPKSQLQGESARFPCPPSPTGYEPLQHPRDPSDGLPRPFPADIHVSLLLQGP
jgi:hypothetical protein